MNSDQLYVLERLEGHPISLYQVAIGYGRSVRSAFALGEIRHERPLACSDLAAVQQSHIHLRLAWKSLVLFGNAAIDTSDPQRCIKKSTKRRC